MLKDSVAISNQSLERIGKQLADVPILFEIATLVDELGLSGYLVGGVVRDLILARPIKDIDLAISASPEYFLKKFIRKSGGHSICLDKKFLTFRLISRKMKQRWFDFTPLRGNSIEEDLRQRDFTINAMAIDLKDLLAFAISPLHLIDPLGGSSDLAQKSIRAVSEEVFRDDPLRILRAFRQAGQLAFQIEENTEYLIRRDRSLLKDTAPERIRDELLLILSLDQATACFSQLRQSGLLPTLFSLALPPPPEEATTGQGSEPGSEIAPPPLSAPAAAFEAWEDKAIRKLSSVEEILSALPIPEHDCLGQIRSLLSKVSGHQITFYPLLKLSAILSALPPSHHQQTKPDKVWDRLDSFLRWLALSNSQRTYTIGCLQGMPRPLELLQSGSAAPRFFWRFFRDFGDEAGLGALILSLASQKAAAETSLELIEALEGLFKQMVSFWCGWQKIKSHPPFLDGNFLLDYFHLSPGPLIGQILDALEEARAEGSIKSKEDAIELARRFLEARR